MFHHFQFYHALVHVNTVHILLFENTVHNKNLTFKTFTDK